MSRLQFRVWDKCKCKMLYDDFIIRPGNPISEELWYKICNGILGEPYPYTNGEDGQYKGAEPMEYPKTMEQNDAITKNNVWTRSIGWSKLGFSRLFQLVWSRRLYNNAKYWFS